MDRVVVTGIGMLCAIAHNYCSLEPALRLRQHRIGPVTVFPTTRPHPVAEIKDKDIDCATTTPFRTSKLAECAVTEALCDADCLRQMAPEDIGVSFSSCTIGMPEMESVWLDMRRGQKHNFSFQRSLSAGIFVESIAEKNGIRGPMISFSTSCSSSANALGYALAAIRQGKCRAMVAGGADALCRLTYYGFQSLKIMSQFPCTPFDIGRQGMNIGEGSGILILESLTSARQRNAKIYGEFLGIGMSADAHHMSTPDPKGKGAYKAMRRALVAAKLQAHDIDYISAHGTGTVLNDLAESAALRLLFADHLDRVPVSSVKSYFGHTMGTAGVLATICALNSFATSFIPPTLGLKEPDAKCNLYHPPARGLNAKVTTALINTFAFGGNNTSLIFKKFGE